MLAAVVVLLSLAFGLAAAPAARTTHATATAAKARSSALTRCMRRAAKARSKHARAARRRACRRTAARIRRRQSFGVSVGGALHNEDPGTLGRDLAAIRRLHAGWVRLDINWAVIQDAGPSKYNWAPIDRMVQAARSDGLNVLGAFVYTPGWARPGGTRATYGPDPGRYAAFAATATRRYAAVGVHAYEIWNEPNSIDAWTPSPDPGAYTRLLKAAYPAIKGADARATVVTGGLGPAYDGGGKISPIHFLQGIYASGGRGSFDAVGHHPYTFPAYPGQTQPWSPWYQMYGTSPSLRGVMVANGDGAKKIWGTEFGAPTGGGGAVTEGIQAKLVSRAITAWTRYRWAGPLFFYQGRDSGTDGSNREDFFGLLRHDFSAKPAYSVLKNSLSIG